MNHNKETEDKTGCSVGDGEDFIKKIANGEKIAEHPEILMFTAPYKLCDGGCKGSQKNIAMGFPLYIGKRGREAYKKIYRKDFIKIHSENPHAPLKKKTTRAPFTRAICSIINVNVISTVPTTTAPPTSMCPLIIPGTCLKIKKSKKNKTRTNYNSKDTQNRLTMLTHAVEDNSTIKSQKHTTSGFEQSGWETTAKVLNMEVPIKQVVNNLVSDVQDSNAHVPNVQVPDLQLSNTQVSNQQNLHVQLLDTQVPPEQVPDTQLSDSQFTHKQYPVVQLSGTPIPPEQVPDMQIPHEQVTDTQISPKQNMQVQLELVPDKQILDTTVPPEQILGTQISPKQILDAQLSNTQILHKQVSLTQISPEQVSDKQLADTPIPLEQIPDMQVSDKQISPEQIPIVQLADTQIPPEPFPDTQVTQTQIPSEQISEVQVSDTQIPTGQVPDVRLADTRAPNVQISHMQVLNASVPDEKLTNTQDSHNQLSTGPVSDTQVPKLQITDMKVPELRNRHDRSRVQNELLDKFVLLLMLAILDPVILTGNMFPSANQLESKSYIKKKQHAYIKEEEELLNHKCECPPNDECIIDYKFNEDMIELLIMQGLLDEKDMQVYKASLGELKKQARNFNEEDIKKAAALRRKRQNTGRSECCCPPRNIMMPTFITDKKFQQFLASKFRNQFTKNIQPK